MQREWESDCLPGYMRSDRTKRRRASVSGVVLMVGLLGWVPCVGSAPVARAQEPEARAHEPAGRPPVTITLEDAVRIALRENTNLRRAQTAVELNDALALREYMNFVPQLELSSGATRSFGRSFSQEEGQILSETSDFFGLDVSATIDLFTGFERFAETRRAGLEKRASQSDLERTRQDVVFTVIQRFTTLLQNRELADVRAQELVAQEELLQQVRGLAEVGRRPVSDLYQQQAARAEAELALMEAEREVELARTQIMQTLQLDPLADYAFEAGEADSILVADSLAREPLPHDLEGFLRMALSRRPDLAALEASVAAEEHGIRAARSGYWPSLSLSFAYGSDWSSEARQAAVGTGTDPRVVTITPDDGEPVTFPVPGTGSDPQLFRPPFLDQLDTRRGGSVRLSMTIPLFDRLQTATAVDQAEAALLDTRYDLQDQRQLVALQVRQALLDHRSARSRLRAADERLEAAGRARDAARRRYDLGAATFVEVTQAESEYVSARSARVRAAYDVILTRRLIEYHTGGLETHPERLEAEEGSI